ncbi:MAG: hypothetical protein ACYSUP_19480 [Planctomycetota bacterium]|jgi:hypothetical protein
MLVKTLQDLTIPRQENVIFVGPESSAWSSLPAENKSRLQDLPDRTKSRSELLAIARNYTRELCDGSCPDTVSDNVIAAGHQPTWHHCGILSKDMAACKFVQAVDGTAVHLVLDHDICDTALTLPEKDASGCWQFRRVEIESEPQNIPLELRPLPGEAQLRAFLETVVSAHPERFCSNIWPECKGFANNQPARFRSVADIITYLQCVLKAALGLEMLYLRVSELCESTAFVDFVVFIISKASAFAGCYNEGVARQTVACKSRGTKAIARLAFDKRLTKSESARPLPN